MPQTQSALYAICSLCDLSGSWCDASLIGFPCTRCRQSKEKCCARGKTSLFDSKRRKEDSSKQTVSTNSFKYSAAEDLFRFKFGSHGGMAENPGVNLTGPLDNLLAEVNDFLGPGPQLFYKPSLPHFIQDIPGHIGEEDIHYLASKSVFEIPEKVIRQEPLRSFIEHVYPFLPVLDLKNLLMAFCHDGRPTKISLFLFQAVMFSAAAFVDMEHLRSSGYRSRKEAREELFSKTRVLYDFDYESNRFVLIQALLLMTYWHETPDNPKDSKYWLDVCWSISSSIGLQDPSTSQTRPEDWKVQKRLWWCFYTRNRLISLNLGRSIGFKKNSDEAFPFPELADFEIHRYSNKVLSTFKGCEFLWNLSLQEHSAVSFIEKAKLSILISDVTDLRDLGGQGLMSHQGLREHDSTTAWTERFGKTLEGLHMWLARTSSELESLGLSKDAGRCSNCPQVHIAWVRLVFLATLSTLYRQNASINMPAENLSREPDRQVLGEMSSITQELHELGLVQLLPTTIVALLVPVLAMHFVDLRSSCRTVQMAGFQNFYRCMAVLASLRDTYSSAIAVHRFFESALDNIGNVSSSRLVPTMIQELLTQKELDLLAQASNDNIESQ